MFCRPRSVLPRQEAKQLRIDAEAKTKWFNYENNVKLNERVRNITEWRDKLDQCLKDINLEISVQKDAKEACERALEAKNMPLEIALENLNVREARQEFDVVKDEVEHQLNREVQLIENIKEKLRMRAEEAWDSLAKLEEIREVSSSFCSYSYCNPCSYYNLYFRLSSLTFVTRTRRWTSTWDSWT